MKSNKCIITCALTGHMTTREMANHLPITPKEQAIDAKMAVTAGASIIHLHVREDDGTATLRPERYHEAIYEIKALVPDAIIEISMRGIDHRTNLPEKIDRGNLVIINDNMWGNDDGLKPDICALNISTRNIGKNTVLINSYSEIQRQIEKIYEYGMIPRCDIYDIGDILAVNRLLEEGILKSPLHMLLIFGSYSGIGVSKSDLEFSLSKLPEDSHWTVLGTGKYNFSMAEYALMLGGNVRTGFEDTTYLMKNVKAKNNAEMVDKMSEICSKFNISVANIAESRKILDL